MPFFPLDGFMSHLETDVQANQTSLFFTAAHHWHPQCLTTHNTKTSAPVRQNNQNSTFVWPKEKLRLHQDTQNSQLHNLQFILQVCGTNLRMHFRISAKTVFSICMTKLFFCNAKWWRFCCCSFQVCFEKQHPHAAFHHVSLPASQLDQVGGIFNYLAVFKTGMGMRSTLAKVRLSLLLLSHLCERFFCLPLGRWHKNLRMAIMVTMPWRVSALEGWEIILLLCFLAIQPLHEEAGPKRFRRGIIPCRHGCPWTGKKF